MSLKPPDEERAMQRSVQTSNGVPRRYGASPEYPQASRFAAAAAGNFRPASRTTATRVVIHITDGSTTAGTVSWFQNPASGVSAHYVVGRDGEVVQMVRHADVAFHARSANADSIGIEHVARAKPKTPPTETEYAASAALVRWLCDTFSIPMDRTHILGHSEADPATTHTACPNSVWDWDYFMGMVKSASSYPQSYLAHPAGLATRSARLAAGVHERYGGAAAAALSSPETGAQFVARISSLGEAKREAAIQDAIQMGQVPDFMADLKEVSLSFTDGTGSAHSAVIKVTPDYLCVGTDADPFRTPMKPATAQRIADTFGMMLPTRKLVDAIWKAAGTKVAPQPIDNSDGTSTAAWAKHNALVEKQLAGAHTELVSGQKKDVVISNELAKNPGKVAIYGWHQLNGKPIQGLSTAHGDFYADYSHGIRLISGTCTVDGEERRLEDVYKDPALAGLVSDEGPLVITRYPTP